MPLFIVNCKISYLFIKVVPFVSALASKPDAIKATPSQVSDAPSHRQYVSAKDLVADFDKGSKHSKAELGSEVNLHNQIEERDSYGYEKPIVRDRELKQPENVVADHAASHRGEQITPEKEPNNARKKEESLTSPKHATPLTTPKNSGFFVNLSDGSGKMSTSTPKPKRQSVKETPPPEASPVKTLDGSQNTPKAVPKKALQKQILSNRGKKTIKVENKEEQIEINRGEQNDDGIIEAVSFLLNFYSSFFIYSFGCFCCCIFACLVLGMGNNQPVFPSSH